MGKMRHVVLTLAPLALGLGLACGSDVSVANDINQPDAEAEASFVQDGGSVSDAAVADEPPAKEAGYDPPVAVGDPCRGVPLPPDKHFVAKGLCARVVAKDPRALRQLTFASNGDLWVATRDGYIKVLRDDNANGFYEPSEIHTWATTTPIGNNVHIDESGGFVYAGSPEGVVRWPYSATLLTAPAPAEPVVVGQPSDGHPLHTVHVYDGYLYVMSGSEGDATNSMPPEYDTKRALLRRWKLATFAQGQPWQWASGENVSLGLRNMVGFTRNAAGRMYGVVNGLDLARHAGVDLHEDNPGEQIVELGKGRNFGFPYCFTAQRAVIDGGLIPPGTQLAYDGWPNHDNAWCLANSMKPTTFVQAHSAPLDILFFELQPKGVLPERWRGGAFVSLHGSHARTVDTGFKVVWIPFDANGQAPMPTSTLTDTTFPYETVFGGGDTNGPKDGPWTWTAPLPPDTLVDQPRPVGLAIHPTDGALYISSDQFGIIYRIGLKP